MLNKVQFDEFCDKVTQMCAGLDAESHTFYDERPANETDFFLCFDSSIIASIVAVAFRPASKRSTISFIGTFVEFKVRELEASHPIFTPEGLEAAHGKIFELLYASVINESGRLGPCIDKLAISIHQSREEIKAAIELKISELRAEFNHSETYFQKNQILLVLRELYHTIRDDERLEQLVSQNTSSMQPK